MDAVGFVVQSNLARLTESQKYIFNSVLEIFGKDVEENVHFLLTFSDGTEPLVLAAIKEAKLPCRMENGAPCYQSFQNNAFFLSNHHSPAGRWSPIQYQWDEGMKNFQSFFEKLSSVQTKSLQLTKEVLTKRETLRLVIAALESTINDRLHKMDELRKTDETIKLHQHQLDAHQNFETTVETHKNTKVPVEKETALNCKKCKTTCHYPCNPSLSLHLCPAFWRSNQGVVKDVLFKSVASFFKKTTVGSCVVCPDSCSMDDHINEKERWKYMPVEEKQTLYDVKKKYEEAESKKLTAEETRNALQLEIEKLKDDLIKDIKKITECSNLLEKISLRNSSLTASDYIKLMIEKEEKEETSGSKQRIECYKDLLNYVRLGQDLN